MNCSKNAIRLSRKASEIEPFLVMEVFERAVALEREGRSIIRLEVGEPDFKTPEVIREAGIRAIRDNHTRYTHSLGHLELREEIANWYDRHYQVEVSPENIVVTLGSSAAMVLAFAALLNPGEEVLLTDPCYACYPKFIQAFDGVPVRVPVFEEDAFQYPTDGVESKIGERTRALLLNSPSNPTGTVTSAKRLQELTLVVGDRIPIISDEIYHGLVYEDRAHSILEFTSHAIVINGFSKLFSMTGWRLGYAVFPESMIRAVQKLQQNLFISAPDFAQFAGVAALRSSEADVAEMVSQYARRRRYVLDRLSRMGLGVAVEPTGAFYVFINVGAYTDNVLEFTFEILEEAGVAVTPGVDFGPHGEGFIRICYANSLDNLEEGMNRLEAFMRNRPRRENP